MYYDNAPTGKPIFAVSMKIVAGKTDIVDIYGDSGIFLESPNGIRIPILVITDINVTTMKANKTYFITKWLNIPIIVTPGEKIIYDFPSLPEDCTVTTVFRREL